MPRPSVLQQAIASQGNVGPETVKPAPDFGGEVEGATKHYAREAWEDLKKGSPLGPIGQLPALISLLTSPGAGLGYATAGRNPAWNSKQRNLLAQITQGVVPIPGAAEEESAAALGTETMKLVGTSPDPEAEINRLGEHVENVPIHWLRRLAHTEFSDHFEEQLPQLTKNVNEGLRYPIVVRAGTKSRNAVLNDIHDNHVVEAAVRAGYTHIPVRVELSPNAGRNESGTTHLERDIIPTHTSHPMSVADVAHAKPSEVFKSLQVGKHPSPQTAWDARNALGYKHGQPGYHGTTRKFEKFQEPLRPGSFSTLDTQFATHFGKDPNTANEFAGGSYAHTTPGANIWPVQIPGPERTYLLEQRTKPLLREKYDPEANPLDQIHRLESDTRSMTDLISEQGFRQRPDLLRKFISRLTTGKPEDLTKMAEDLAAGHSVRLSPREQPLTLRQLLEVHNAYGQSPLHEGRDELIKAARAALKKQGYSAVEYTNTAPGEVGKSKDPTSFMVPDTRDILAHGDPRQTDTRLISREHWRRMMGLK